MVSSETPESPADGSRRRIRGRVAPEGHLPVTEFLSDRPGAASPFGDDLSFPLAVSELAYRHPEPDN